MGSGPTSCPCQPHHLACMGPTSCPCQPHHLACMGPTSCPLSHGAVHPSVVPWRIAPLMACDPHGRAVTHPTRADRDCEAGVYACGSCETCVGHRAQSHATFTLFTTARESSGSETTSTSVESYMCCNVMGPSSPYGDARRPFTGDQVQHGVRV